MTWNSKFLSCIIAILVAGCTGKEVGRIPVNTASTDLMIVKESNPIPLKKGEKLYFWADMNMEYEGDLELRFVTEIYKDGQNIGSVDLNPMDNDIKMNAVETSFGNSHKASYLGRMDFLEIKEDGAYTFKTALSSNSNPTLKLNKAELVLRK
jgi:hypothetical protein